MIASLLFELVREILTPAICCHCQKAGSFLCSDCYEQVTFSWQNQHQISNSENNSQLEKVFTLGKFDGPIKSMVMQLKYQGVQELGATIAQLIYHTMYLPTVNLIIPVPAHQDRLRQRGFNQAELIAKQLALIAGIPYLEVLTRTIHLTPQAQISDKAVRQTRQQHTMNVTPQGKIDLYKQPATSIVIIDDVFTTGATLTEAARALQSVLPTTRFFGLTVAQA